jgi:Flp pilus assembly protein TadG
MARRAGVGSLKVKGLRERGGNVAVITALLTPLLVLLVGGAIDLTNASMRQAQLQQSVDAAAVSVVARYSDVYTTALTMTSDGPVVPSPNDVTQNAQAVFNANYQTNGPTTLNSFSVSAQKTANVVSATVTASGAFQPNFLGLIGITSIPLSATSVTDDNMPSFINYYILVDASQSMGIAATQTDMNNLYARVSAYGTGTGDDGSPGCVFGCHVTTNINHGNHGLQTYSNEYLAHNISPKITLRIDSAIAAIQDVISSAQTAAGTLKNVKIGIYQMSRDPTTGTLVTQISAPSNNYSDLQTLANGLDLGNNTSSGVGDSDFPNEINYFVSKFLGNNGTGLTASSPINYVFIVSDGLYDVPGSCTDGHCTSAFVSNGTSPSCSQIKQQATVGVIYTTYNPIYYDNTPTTLNDDYSPLAAPYAAGTPSPITTNLTACASSPSLFYTASDGPGIDSAMQALFSYTLKTARVAS